MNGKKGVAVEPTVDFQSSKLTGILSANEINRREIAAGLTESAAQISSKYFYDIRGSRLFEMITALPEYYLTRTEHAIFTQYGDDMAVAAGSGSVFIDLGAGNCNKAKNLFCAFRPAQYVAVDISIEFLHHALARLQKEFPELPTFAVGSDIFPALTLPLEIANRRRLFFYPGSSIGNFTLDQARLFLTKVREQCGAAGSLLIGVDLVKPDSVLTAAYDDASGVTAAFNLNVLRNLNRILGSNFATEDWRHRAFFDAERSRIEMHLEARRQVRVRWPGGARVFAKGETIHTENSYKYTLGNFERLLTEAGFSATRTWTDAKQWFAVCHASA